MRLSSVAPLLAALPTALAKPSQPPFSNTTALPTHWGLLVFPHFQALDVFGPIDVFNNLAMMYKNSTSMYLTILSRTMAPVTTGMAGMAGGFEEKIVPTTTFQEYLTKGKPHYGKPADGKPVEDCDDGAGGHAIAKRAMRFGARQDHGSMPHDMMPPMPPKDLGDIEVLIVPGGGGTRSNVTEEIAFIKEMYPKVKWILSICTGATLLSRAGVLDGKKATTNKFSWAWASAQGPNVTWIPTARWVEDGNIISSSGVSAGIDAAYALISRIYGEPVADYLAKAAEYNREMDPHRDVFGKIWEVPGAT
ncbi:class I glutamine amidotransferase-like protein [Phaeosphaeria sp. MPI-PUGE-AT-0046c]|nr:class I glutamine amidotransferase-like protein [Phaeosphaeria sp. MPI-PUGE-AT-0046c]